MVRTKQGQKIHVDTLQTALEKLEQLETKPKSELNLRESIFFLKDKLNSALKKGYSYQDLSEILSGQEIMISAATLKQYLTEMSKKKSRSRKKKSKSVSSSGSGLKTSTNITDSKEDNQSSNSQSGINRIEESDGLDSTDSKSVKTKAKPKSKSKSQTKAKVLSGFDDDLSSDFNSY
ncbi:MAG: hypothetical protein AAF652_03065 [Cyanobacteria bacterium P01_C01_bin.72]